MPSRVGAVSAGGCLLETDARPRFERQRQLHGPVLVDVSLANLTLVVCVEGQDEVRVLLKALTDRDGKRPCRLEEQQRASAGTSAASLANLRDLRGEALVQGSKLLGAEYALQDQMTERQSAVALGTDCIDVFGERVRPANTGSQRNAARVCRHANATDDPPRTKVRERHRDGRGRVTHAEAFFRPRFAPVTTGFHARRSSRVNPSARASSLTKPR